MNCCVYANEGIISHGRNYSCFRSEIICKVSHSFSMYEQKILKFDVFLKVLAGSFVFVHKILSSNLFQFVRNLAHLHPVCMQIIATTVDLCEYIAFILWFMRDYNRRNCSYDN